MSLRIYSFKKEEEDVNINNIIHTIHSAKNAEAWKMFSADILSNVFYSHFSYSDSSIA